ncbi:hypothetical protein Tco_0821108 [Tanacetum coccineum]|uniref:Uncharacterized protein n=1 Tax=Tanacetum coccineum TaxID=301880 RepID=A0ABQ5AFM4_9ASTR
MFPLQVLLRINARQGVLEPRWLHRCDRRIFGLEARDRCHDEGLFGVIPRNEFMLLREILLDVVGTSGYHCGVLRSFPVERIEQGNE